jgi:hypothetical protein
MNTQAKTGPVRRKWHLMVLLCMIHTGQIMAQSSYDHHHWPKEHKIDMEAHKTTATTSAATADHAVTWYVGGKGHTRKSIMHLNSYDRKTGTLSASKEVEWPFKITRVPVVERGVEWNGSLYLFSFVYDRNKRELELYYQAYDPKDLSEVLPRTPLATIPTHHIPGHMYGAGLQFARSPDGTKLSIYYPNGHDKAESQHLNFWVLDKQGAMLWSASHAMDMKMQGFISQAHAVDDHGVVHILASIYSGEKKERVKSFGSMLIGVGSLWKIPWLHEQQRDLFHCVGSIKSLVYRGCIIHWRRAIEDLGDPDGLHAWAQVHRSVK